MKHKGKAKAAFHRMMLRALGIYWVLGLLLIMVSHFLFPGILMIGVMALTGLLIGFGLMLFVWVYCKIKGWGKRDGEGRLSLGPAIKQAAWALLMPVIILGGIYGGIFTPTEASAVAVVYALFVGMVVYREIKPSDLIPILKKSAISSSVSVR